MQLSLSSISSKSDEAPALWRVAIAMGLLAGVGLGLQVLLTRVFSLLFQYHFVFLVVSLALLGLGLGAALAYAARQKGWAGFESVWASSVALAATLLLCTLVFAGLTASSQLPIAFALSLIPFGLLGWINAQVYAEYPTKSNVIYGVDLMGAALGVALSLALLAWVGAFTALLVSAAIVTSAALLLGGSRIQKFIAVVLTCLLLALSLANHSSQFIRYDPEAVTEAAPDKTIIGVLRDPALGAEVLSTHFGAFAQVDVVKTQADKIRYIFADGGAGSLMVNYDPQVSITRYDWLEGQIPYLPFTAGPVDKTLIIGAGAGYDVLLAKYAGAEAITALEVNAATVAATRAYADYNGNILDAPGVKTIVGDGRNFVERSREQFDLIYLNVVLSQAANPTNGALTENYAFTLEAFRSYWNRLEEGGRLGIVGHNGIEGVRLLMTALAMLQTEGFTLQQALSRTALVMSDPKVDPESAPSVLVLQKQPWSLASAQAFTLKAANQGLIPLFVPGVFESSLKVLLNGKMSLGQYLAANTEYNIFPTSDNRPFFYNLSQGVPAALQTLLWVSLGMLLVFWLWAAMGQPNAPRRLGWLGYFTLLGVGYMLVEVALLKRFELLLGHPVLALVVTLGALLLAGGLGSLLAGRWNSRFAALAVVLMLSVAWFAYPILVEGLLPLELPLRITATVLAILPLALALGLMFPSGLQRASQADPEGIPLFWGVNALAAVAAGALATVLGLLVGFQVVFLVGIGVYLLAGLGNGFKRAEA
jgi:hypothetical protein